MMSSTFFQLVSKVACTIPGHHHWSKSMIQFFEKLPLNAFPYLRSLTLTFPDFMPQSVLSDRQGGMKTWEHAIGVIAQRIDFPRLSLTILIENPRNNTSREPAEDWLQAYKKIVRPLTRLKRMLNLFIHLSRPYGSEEEYESMLKKSVLGEYYDAISRGKYHVKRPFWDDCWSERPVFQSDGLKLCPPDYWNVVYADSLPNSKNCSSIGIRHRGVWSRVWGPEEAIIWLHEAYM